MVGFNRRENWIYLLSALTAFIFYGAQSVSAADLVTGHYVSSSGKSIELSLDIQTPAPVSLIIEQYLPPGTKIVDSKPKFKKYNSKKGKVKWLLKNVRSGKKKVTLQLADAIGQGNVRALLRCKDPATGGFIEKTVTP